MPARARTVAWLFALLLGCFLATSAHAQTFPPLTGRVVDAANILPPQQAADLSNRLEALEAQSQRQLVVATIPDLQGYDIADYGYQLGRAWGIGDQQRNDGILLIVAPNDRKVRIEVGYGLEGIMTDALSNQIIQQQILPRFRDGDMPGGIVAGTDALIAQLQLPEEEARKVAAQAAQQQSRGEEINIGPLIFWGLILFFFVILPILRSAGRGRRHGSGLGSIILWEIASAAARGASNGGGSGWGGGGGGGFGGGGGSFGGGGSSGSW
ncbi:MAG: TPM domain-containing protein [Parasphingorhabdus sp.]|nr:TPM domain-containing protein [Parasphingorhabdus sp.]